MTAPDQTLFFSADGPISACSFASGAEAISKEVSGFSHICNLLQDRMHFAQCLTAALLNGQDTILPPSDAPNAVSSSIAGAESPVVMNDRSRLPLPLAEEISANSANRRTESFFENLANSEAEIGVFTSGTTKQPERVVKTWDILKTGASITDLVLNQLDAPPENLALLGTTPPRHMFGLEATIFATLGYERCTYRDTIFYPADLEVALEVARSLGRSRLVLVTSPAHLRFFEPTILTAPEICCVLSATAPLSAVLAERLEARGDLRVMEIYGSSETGSLAYRRTAFDQSWTPAAGFQLRQEAGNCTATAQHLPAPICLGDEIDLQADGRFRLLGRSGDMISIHGKRNRLSALNAVLSEVPDLSDATYLHIESNEDDRLAIAVVPNDPARDPDDLRQRLREYLLKFFEPAFVPKRVLVLDHIPRTATGKISNETTRKLEEQAGIAR